jgi:hypothetical protein
MNGKIGWKNASRTLSGSLVAEWSGTEGALPGGTESRSAVLVGRGTGDSGAPSVARSALRVNKARAAGDTPASIDRIRFSKGSTPLITRPILPGRQ